MVQMIRGKGMVSKQRWLIGGYLVALLFLVVGCIRTSPPTTPTVDRQRPGQAIASLHQWNDRERAILEALAIQSLPEIPPDPSNRVEQDPRAIALGEKLFFDTRLSINGKVACATCHIPERAFTDGLARSRGVGITERNAPTVLGAAYSPWQFWDGRKDTLWSQALGPLESAVEHGASRTFYAHAIATYYKKEYEEIFGKLPDLSNHSRYPPHAGPVEDPTARNAWNRMAAADRERINRIYANIGKTIAAFERTLVPGPARFDDYVAAVLAGDTRRARTILTDDEVAGLRIFIGKGKCLTCHTGPLFTNFSFHNIGTPPPADLADDPGRYRGLVQVLNDEFNCLGPYSDAKPAECTALNAVYPEPTESLKGAFKTPTLRNVALTAPYMSSGQLATLDEVMVLYNQGIPQVPALGLSEQELQQLVAFMHTLTEKEALGSGPPTTNR